MCRVKTGRAGKSQASIDRPTGDYLSDVRQLVDLTRRREPGLPRR
jgi:hypothetical protein